MSSVPPLGDSGCAVKSPKPTEQLANVLGTYSVVFSMLRLQVTSSNCGSHSRELTGCVSYGILMAYKSFCSVSLTGHVPTLPTLSQVTWSQGSGTMIWSQDFLVVPPLMRFHSSFRQTPCEDLGSFWGYSYEESPRVWDDCDP